MSDIKENQPFLYAPVAVLGLCAVLLVIFGAYYFVNDWVRNYFLFWGALLPLRFFGETSMLYPEVPWRGVWTLVTHAFLHGSWEHVILNSFWILIFGTPVARRLGSLRFLALFVLGAALAALFYVAVGVRDELMLGASGGAAALLGASVRFAFGGAGERRWNPLATDILRQPLLSVVGVLRQRTAFTFIVIWLVVDFLFAWTGFSVTGASVNIAWSAHIGGFVAGFFLIWALDRPIYSESGGQGLAQYGSWAGSEPAHEKKRAGSEPADKKDDNPPQ